MAMVQVRRPSAGQAYYRRKLAEGKAPKEALRCLKRRLSDAVYRCLLADQHHPTHLILDLDPPADDAFHDIFLPTPGRAEGGGPGGSIPDPAGEDCQTKPASGCSSPRPTPPLLPPERSNLPQES